jgi:beta-phosphoglucomutase-like phosphatase (HAD superfamily)
MTPKMVIFDCDGVLVDSERPLHQVLVGNLAKYGLNISVDQSLATLSGMVMSEVARLAT